MLFVWLTKEEAEAARDGLKQIWTFPAIEAHTKVVAALREDAKLPSGPDIPPTMVAYRYGVREVAVSYADQATADRAWDAIRKSITASAVVPAPQTRVAAEAPRTRQPPPPEAAPPPPTAAPASPTVVPWPYDPAADAAGRTQHQPPPPPDHTPPPSTV